MMQLCVCLALEVAAKAWPRTADSIQRLPKDPNETVGKKVKISAIRKNKEPRSAILNSGPVSLPPLNSEAPKSSR